MTRIHLLLPALLLAGCGDPPCTGEVTMDLGGGGNGCTGAWINGEQMCPQEIWCDVTVTCMAFTDWDHGTCSCGHTPDVCCDLDIIWPPGDSVLTMSDDVDLGRPGLQLDVTAQADCWGDWYGTQMKVAICGEDAMIPEGVVDPGTTVDTRTRATGRIDLGDSVGCFPLCAEVVIWGSTVITHDTIEICVE